MPPIPKWLSTGRRRCAETRRNGCAILSGAYASEASDTRIACRHPFLVEI
ncbi:hypothetical protein ACFSF2_21780 [Paenibacillus rhizophilus]